MRAIFNLSMIWFVILLLSLTGCSDDEGTTEGNLVGTWRCTVMDGNPLFGDFFGDGEQYLQFKADGTFIEVDIYYDYYVDGKLVYEGETEVLRGKWVRSGDKITLSGGGEPTVTYEITKLTDSIFHVLCFGITMTYDRVDDSAIEPYL